MVPFYIWFSIKSSFLSLIQLWKINEWHEAINLWNLTKTKVEFTFKNKLMIKTQKWLWMKIGGLESLDFTRICRFSNCLKVIIIIRELTFCKYFYYNKQKNVFAVNLESKDKKILKWFYLLQLRCGNGKVEWNTSLW